MDFHMSVVQWVWHIMSVDLSTVSWNGIHVKSWMSEYEFINKGTSHHGKKKEKKGSWSQIEPDVNSEQTKLTKSLPGLEQISIFFELKSFSWISNSKKRGGLRYTNTDITALAALIRPIVGFAGKHLPRLSKE